MKPKINRRITYTQFIINPSTIIININFCLKLYKRFTEIKSKIGYTFYPPLLKSEIWELNNHAKFKKFHIPGSNKNSIENTKRKH